MAVSCEEAKILKWDDHLIHFFSFALSTEFTPALSLIVFCYGIHPLTLFSGVGGRQSFQRNENIGRKQDHSLKKRNKWKRFRKCQNNANRENFRNNHIVDLAIQKYPFAYVVRI